MAKHLTTKGLLLVLLLSTFQLTQAQDILWEKSYGGKHAEYLFDVIPTPDYGFILAGSSLSKKTGNKTEDNRGDLDYWVWKMDEKGELDWQKSLGGSGQDLLRCIKLTSDGGFILGGQSSSVKDGDKSTLHLGGDDLWIVKLNPKGQIEWQLTLGGSGQEILHCITPTTDGGYILGASSSSNITDEDLSQSTGEVSKKEKIILKDTNSFGNLDYWIVKIDGNGELQWQQSFGGIYTDILKTIIEIPKGGYIVGGYSNSPEANVLKTGTGIPKSEKCYGLGDYWVISLDKQGKVLWEKVYGGEEEDKLQAMLITSDNHLLIGGNSNSNTTGNKDISNGKGADFWLLETDINGAIIWQRTYDTGKRDVLTSVIRNNDGTLILGGYAQSEVTGTKNIDKEDVNDYILLKAKANGEEIWKRTVGSNGKDVLKMGIETRDGGYLLCGTSSGKPSRDKESGVGRNDFWVVKLLDKDKPKIEKEPIEAIPNPAIEYTNIIVGFEFEQATLSLFDLSGRQLQSFSIQERTVPLNVNGLPEGIYVVQVKSKENKGSVKIIKRKK